MEWTEEYLSYKGVSMQEARDFIMDNVTNDLHTVFSVCVSFGVNNDMIADILQSDFPGLTGEVVSEYFDANGFSGSLLGFTDIAPTAPTTPIGPIDVVADGTYQGTYSGAEYGEFAFLVNDTYVQGQWYSPSYQEYGDLSGTVDNATGAVSLYSADEDGIAITFTGVISGDDASGSWSMPSYGSGSFDATLVG